MRTLTSTLSAAQKTASYNPIYKVVLTRTGESTQTYTKTRILSIDHIEGRGAEIVLDNSDNTLSALNFEHYQVVISYGITTSAGDEYSDTAPLRVRAQELTSQAGTLVCKITAIGIMGQLTEDLAQVDYTLLDTDTQTCKTLINLIAGSTMATFAGYPAYTTTYDSEDSIIDSFKPADYFSIHINANRGDKINELLDFTACKVREEDDGELHFLVPVTEGKAWTAGSTYAVNTYVQPTTPNDLFTYQCTTAGTAAGTTEPTWPTVAGSTVADSSVVWTARGFHYEYALADTTQHTFFNKSLRNRFVNPNKEIVKSPAAAATVYSASTTSATSYALAPKIHTTELALTSNAEAAKIAAAIIQRYELQAESGATLVPMNVGQELWDYVKVTDARESSDYIIGNIQYLRRSVSVSKRDKAPKYEMQISLGPVAGGLDKLIRAAGEAGEQTVTKTITWGVEGAIAATTNVSFEIPAPTWLTCENVFINVKTAPTGTSLIVDVNLNGASIFATQANRPEIAAAGYFATSGVPDTTGIWKNGILSIDIDQSGAVAAEDLTVEVRCTEKVKK